jgi:hypothetical protein
VSEMLLPKLPKINAPWCGPEVVSARAYKASNSFWEVEYNLAQARVVAGVDEPIEGNRHERRRVTAIERGLRKRLQKEAKP